ncbi:phosphopantetheine-binding protein [Streptomyces sp. NPDC088789]|uniref:phosphopantetheine-binding protein n=1 Tax=Streptomyces sp. NPDC088789 TaxID=3365899 RepID=UPI0038121317
MLHESGELSHEEQIAHKIAELLEHQHVRPEDDFFELGGYSFPAVALLAWVADETGVQVDLREFFKEPTARGLATTVAAGRVRN